MKEGAQSAVAAALQNADKERKLAAAAFALPVVSGQKQAVLLPKKIRLLPYSVWGLPGADAEMLSGKMSGRTAARE